MQRQNQRETRFFGDNINFAATNNNGVNQRSEDVPRTEQQTEAKERRQNLKSVVVVSFAEASFYSS